MHLLFFIIILFLSACGPTYTPNGQTEIVLIHLDSRDSLDVDRTARVLRALNTIQPAVVGIKPLLPGDSLIAAAMQRSEYPIYSSARTMDQRRNTNLNEDDIFQKTPFLLNRSFRDFEVPAEMLLSYYRGVGPETAEFRNNGQIESYYVTIGINGKAFASLPLLMAMELTGKTVDDLNGANLYMSKRGTMAVRFSSPGSAYRDIPATDIISGNVDVDAIRGAAVILYDRNEMVPTLGGAKKTAEITADVLNQLLIQFKR